jgi:hypothetical protein
MIHCRVREVWYEIKDDLERPLLQRRTIFARSGEKKWNQDRQVIPQSQSSLAENCAQRQDGQPADSTIKTMSWGVAMPGKLGIPD